jgi:hypothetical protein
VQVGNGCFEFKQNIFKHSNVRMRCQEEGRKEGTSDEIMKCI